jgi:hypothetical protein
MVIYYWYSNHIFCPLVIIPYSQTDHNNIIYIEEYYFYPIYSIVSVADHLELPCTHDEIILAAVNAVVVCTITGESWGALCDLHAACTGDMSLLTTYDGIVRIGLETARRKLSRIELLT